MAFGSNFADHLKTEGSPRYGITDPEFYKSIGIASILMIATIAAMLITANTVIADFVLALYNLFWFLGVIVVGGFLSVGWYIGLLGIDKDIMGLAVFGILLTIFGYGAFGGAILSQYSSSIWLVSLAITSIITISITILLSIYIFTGGRNLSSWGTYSGICFLIGLIISFIASFAVGLQVVAFGFILLGFIFELGYEIWLCSRSDRSPFANGFAIYFAFAGVFVHILQIVLESQGD